MSEKDILEEIERNSRKNTVFHNGKAADGSTIDSEYPERKQPADNSLPTSANTQKKLTLIKSLLDDRGSKR